MADYSPLAKLAPMYHDIETTTYWCSYCTYQYDLSKLESNSPCHFRRPPLKKAFQRRFLFVIHDLSDLTKLLDEAIKQQTAMAKSFGLQSQL